MLHRCGRPLWSTKAVGRAKGVSSVLSFANARESVPHLALVRVLGFVVHKPKLQKRRLGSASVWLCRTS